MLYCSLSQLLMRIKINICLEINSICLENGLYKCKSDTKYF